MRKLNIKRAIALDMVSERRTKRCSPRLRPGDRFFELSFRYLSTGSEGKKCRPLTHFFFLLKIKTLFTNKSRLSTNSVLQYYLRTTNIAGVSS